MSCARDEPLLHFRHSRGFGGETAPKEGAVETRQVKQGSPEEAAKLLEARRK